MKSSAVVVTALVAAVVFAVVGYFVGTRSVKPLAGHPPKADCRGNDCKVMIQFDCDSSPCVPFASPEVILTTANHKIEFEIDSSTTYEFDATDGIKFTSANSGDHLPCQKNQTSRKKFKCDIKDKTPPDLYKYQIHVTGLTIVDPYVVNY